MKAQKYTSLGDQVSQKISAWILILVLTVIIVLFFMSFLLSRQMFNRQVSIWDVAAPQYALTNLIDSDNFSIKREIEFLKSTELFSSFVITDNQKQIISKFGNDSFSDKNFSPIQDETKSIWGYYYFKPDFYKFISPFLVAAVCFFILISIVYFVIRWRIRTNLEYEFSRFNHFLNEIEKFTENLHEVYNEESELKINSSSSVSAEQIIINNAISRLLNEIKKSNQSLREAVSSAEQRKFQEELTRTALQVAHDIGSPLAGLEAIVQSTSLALPENDRTSIRNAAGRIRDISNTLLYKTKNDLLLNNEGLLSQQLLQSLINQVISEKRMQHEQRVIINTKYSDKSHTLFALVRSADFCRVLSNLINNAIEAINDSGHIIISLSDLENNVIIKIQDNGKGIPTEFLNQLGSLGKTFGKPQGLGIGLYHAINTINNWDGQLEIQSKEAEGTTVKISLPKTQPPSWSVPMIEIENQQTIVIIDDEPFIHALWEEKFNPFKEQVKLAHFFSLDKFAEWHNKEKINYDIKYLCDYEFIGSTQNGIDLISRLKINYLSILVTSRLTDELISHCEILGIKLLPKDMVNSIPIKLLENSL